MRCREGALGSDPRAPAPEHAGQVMLDVSVGAVADGPTAAGLSADELVSVGVELIGGTLRLEVDNPRTAGTVTAREPDPNHGGGFGLNVVQTLAHAWGVTRDVRIRVWVEMDRWPVAS